MVNVEYETTSIQLQPGDFLVLYTDGIVEAENEADEIYGDDRLRSIIRRADAQISARELLNDILFDVQTFSGESEQYDDITLVILKVIG